MEEHVSNKFSIIGYLEEFLLKSGISDKFTDLITFLFAIVLIIAVIMLFDYIFNQLSIKVIHRITEKSITKWDDFLTKRNFFRRTIRFLMSVIMIYLIPIFLSGYSPSVVNIGVVLAELVAILFMTLMVLSLLNSLHDIYNTLPRSKEKSISGYMQTVKIIVISIAIITGLVTIFNVSFGKFFTGIAASAAVVTLVFKDTILGFIASIQLSALDMIKLGDWIQMPSKYADGSVVEINISSVKVQNWDKTYTLIPIYSMITEAYINWRGMEEGDGRRFKRTFKIDLTSIKNMTNEDVVKLKEIPLFAPYYEEMIKDRVDFNNGITTNNSLFRMYAEIFLKRNKEINTDMTLLVRYLEMDDKGLPLEIYAFTRTKEWIKYERIVSVITEHIIFAGTLLGIKIFQRSSTPANTQNS